MFPEWDLFHPGAPWIGVGGGCGTQERLRVSSHGQRAVGDGLGQSAEELLRCEHGDAAQNVFFSP